MRKNKEKYVYGVTKEEARNKYKPKGQVKPSHPWYCCACEMQHPKSVQSLKAPDGKLICSDGSASYLLKLLQGA